MNRGSAYPVRKLWKVVPASMRPRFMNRGSPSPAARNRCKLPCFNEAPIHESGKFRHRGHGDHRAIRFNEAPIHESGKCHDPLEKLAQAVSASMRPRFMNRGSIETRENALGGITGFNEAPIHESGKCGNTYYQFRSQGGLQ